MRKRSHKLGLPPGSLVFVGEDRTTPVTISAIEYDAHTLDEAPLTHVDEAGAYRDTERVSWLTFSGVHDVDLIQKVGEQYQIHPLVLEDILHPQQRPKLEVYDAYLYIVLKMLSFDDERRRLHTEQVSLVVGPRYVLLFLEDPGDVFSPLRDWLRTGRGRIRTMGADYLAYAVLDMVVDNYFTVLEGFSDLAETLEERILQDPQTLDRQHISDLRRDLIELRRAVWPVRELLINLERSDTPLMRDETRPFLRDAYDHTVQVIDLVESLREMVAGLFDLYMSGLSNRMNEIMKFLTVVGTIFIPLTFIVGVYGMNFDHMPELHTRYGYFVTWGVMGVVAGLMLLFFRRKRWL